MVDIIRNGEYKYGTIDTLEAQSIPRGAAASSLNWRTMGDHIEIRRGQAYLGTASVNTGNGRATGLKKATNALGVEILFGTYGQKLKYYNRTTEEWVESGSDRLGSAVVDSNGLGFEEIFMEEYVSPAGNQMFLNSPNCSGYYKILVANPGSSVNVYSSSKNFKGNIKIDTNRTLLWRRNSSVASGISGFSDKVSYDLTGVYGSYIDTQAYTTVTSENVGTGDGVTKTFNDTLAQATSTQTVFGLVVTDGTVTFADDFAGNLTGSDGSTGTINYVTGAISLTFITAPINLQAITCTYQYENSNSAGITDFTKAATRLAGQGFIFRQDEGGGDIKNIATFNQIYYCFHLKKTWVLNIGADDTAATNLPFRQKVGIPNERAKVETGEGIYYIDDTDENDVRVRILTYDVSGSAQVIPVSVSSNINLNNYRFDQAAAIEYGNLVLFACGTKESTQSLDDQTVTLNNRVLVYDRQWRSWDILDYTVTCFEIYDGTLIAGDSLSNNFIALFSGFDDFDADAIENYWVGDLDDLDTEGLKKSKRLVLRGLIATDQKLKVSVSIDGGQFVEVGGSDSDDEHTYAIEGGGSYVDRGQAVTIGSLVLGHGEIGGGSEGAVAYIYQREFRLNLAKFEYIQIKYEAVGTGYVSVSTQKFWDIRPKSKKSPLKYRG